MQVSYGHSPSDYGTDVYVRVTEDFIKQAASASRPFFAYLAVYAPHKPATPAPQDANSFPGLQAPRDPSFNEADVSDKPQLIQSSRSSGQCGSSGSTISIAGASSHCKPSIAG